MFSVQSKQHKTPFQNITYSNLLFLGSPSGQGIDLQPLLPNRFMGPCTWPRRTSEKCHPNVLVMLKLNKTGPIALHTSNKDKIMTLLLDGLLGHSLFSQTDPYNIHEITVVCSIHMRCKLKTDLAVDNVLIIDAA